MMSTSAAPVSARTWSTNQPSWRAAAAVRPSVQYSKPTIGPSPARDSRYASGKKFARFIA